jgi:hypothetical protein
MSLSLFPPEICVLQQGNLLVLVSLFPYQIINRHNLCFVLLRFCHCLVFSVEETRPDFICVMLCVCRVNCLETCGSGTIQLCVLDAKVSDNKVLRRILGPKRQEVPRRWKKLHS